MAIVESNQESQEVVFLKVDGILHRVRVADISILEAQGDYLSVHTTERRYFVHSTLKGFISQLPANEFIRVHRSYAARVDLITMVRANNLIVGEKEIPIGVTYRKALAELLSPPVR